MQSNQQQIFLCVILYAVQSPAVQIVYGFICQAAEKLAYLYQRRIPTADQQLVAILCNVAGGKADFLQHVSQRRCNAALLRKGYKCIGQFAKQVV